MTTGTYSTQNDIWYNQIYFKTVRIILNKCVLEVNIEIMTLQTVLFVFHITNELITRANLNKYHKEPMRPQSEDTWPATSAENTSDQVTIGCSFKQDLIGWEGGAGF